jgi:polyisoprenyl-phosphate glycosyltransferase
MPEISIIVPIYNEQDNIEPFVTEVKKVLNDITANYEIIFISDGSIDESCNNVLNLATIDSRIKLIEFSRNFGKEAATTCGIDYAKGNVVIPIDVDLQDPPEVIKELYSKWKEGYDVVLATRRKRDDTFCKKFTAKIFHYIFCKLMPVKIPENTGDFRLMDKKVVNIIRNMREKTRFMKGIMSWSGFKTTEIYFDRPDRKHGETAWGYFKLWQFALDGIFSFSSVPLTIWTYIGALIASISLLYAITIISKVLIFGIDVPGYASIMTTILFIGGIQLISLGIIGEYISRIYNETKNRPIYAINNLFNIDNDK